MSAMPSLWPYTTSRVIWTSPSASAGRPGPSGAASARQSTVERRRRASFMVRAPWRVPPPILSPRTLALQLPRAPLRGRAGALLERAAVHVGAEPPGGHEVGHLQQLVEVLLQRRIAVRGDQA